jgi:hypothetical protein
MIASTARISSPSTHRPPSAAAEPTATPRVSARSTEKIPTPSETRAP